MNLALAPLMMYVCPAIGTVTHVDTIYSADGRIAQGVGKALEITGENPCGSLCFGRSQDQGLIPKRNTPYLVPTYPVFAEKVNLTCNPWEAAPMLLRKVAKYQDLAIRIGKDELKIEFHTQDILFQLTKWHKKDKFSLAHVRVVHLGEVRNVEMIIQEMTGKTRKVKMEKRNTFDLYVTSGGSCPPRKKLQGSSSRRIND
ncbi:hypothetical protein TURU_168103 [Turdus rufiventris]|nr:hypothetical protein TURU_168103 [Turdus rufiventris]